MRTKKHFFSLFAALMVCTGAMLLTACVELDNPAWSNPLGDKIYGIWYADYQESGTTPTDIPYSRVVEAVKFNSDGTGMWWKFMFNADHADTPLSIDGGSYDGTFDYNVAADGTITAKRRASTQSYEIPDLPLLTFRYQNGILIIDGSDASLTMQPAPEGYEDMLLAMEKSQYGAEADNYNINDKDFTPENWRQQAAIYIYDGVGADVTDEKGRTGYTTVNLPWYKDGVVNTNLDPEFCDDITPENGWEWVLNLCGNRSIVNNNFFAVYNKYSGVLRFFYYMPNAVTSGDDHLWEIDMTNTMAQRSNWGYGLPMDLKIENKALLGQDKDNFFVDYITPYVRQLAADGKITMNPGWWAFDIDMSLYRPDDNSFAGDQSISLQIRSWDQSHVTLTSAITGKLDGEMKLDQTRTRTIVSKKKGLFGFINDAISLGKTAVSAVTSAEKGDVIGAIKNGISTAKSGYAFYGALKNNKNSSTTVTDTLSRITGTFNANIQADAETDGIITTSKPVMGAASPTFSAKQFIIDGNGLGKGVWNLKTSPVVYYFDKSMRLRYHEYYCITFFDPSSVEVVLNPDVFPESDIEWVEVDALAGVRTNGSDVDYRKAFGLSYSLDAEKGTNRFPSLVHDYYWWFDFFYNSDEKYGMDYLHDQQYKGDQLISGRCLNGEYYLEPCLKSGLPNTEVNVKVVVKLKSMDAPIVLSRSYLPTVKPLEVDDISKFAALYDKIANSKKNGKFERGPIYDYQLKRLHSIRRYLDNEFEFKAVKTLSDGCYDIKDALTNNYEWNGAQALYLMGSAQEDNWNFEWSYDKPAAPWAYEITGIYQTLGDDKAGTPVSWKLKAKLNEGDEWTLLDEQNDNNNWYSDDIYWAETTKFDIRVKNQPWQYYRLEFTRKTHDNYDLIIPNVKLLY